MDAVEGKSVFCLCLPAVEPVKAWPVERLVCRIAGKLACNCSATLAFFSGDYVNLRQ